MIFTDPLQLKDIPFSLTDKCFLCRGCFYSLYDMGRSLNKSQRRAVIHRLKQNKYRVHSLEFYEYAPTASMQHLFVHLEGSSFSLPWFVLERDFYEAIVKAVFENFFFNSKLL